MEWIWIVAVEFWSGVEVESKWSWIGVVRESWRLEVEEWRTSWLNTLRHVKAMSEKGIWALEVRGIATSEGDWNRRDWNPTRKLVKCTGALHSSFQPNQAVSCSVELTEGWCQVADLERGAALLPRRDPQFTLRGTKVVRC